MRPAPRSLSAEAASFAGVGIQGFAARESGFNEPVERELDESQLAVLDLHDAETAAVIGAPGSGKTTTLIELAADRVLRRGYTPDELLVLTPTRLSATRLRDRLALRIGAPTNGPLARTATSLAFQLVGDLARVEGQTPPQLLTGGEQDQIIAELLAGHEQDGTGPVWAGPLNTEVRRLRGFRTELRELMARCAEHGVSPAELQRLGRERAFPEWIAAGEFIVEYQRVVDSYRGNFVDSAELLAAATVVIGSGRGLTSTRLVIVDDLQESSAATVGLLRAIASRGIPVVAFGDPDVATTAFRGAEAEALGQLGARLGVRAHTIVLSTVHRHGAHIRSLTMSATQRIGAAAAGKQRAARSSREAVLQAENRVGAGAEAVPEVVRIEASSPAAERTMLARQLREHHLLRGIRWSDMAVIVRSGAQVPAVARALAVAEVPTRMSAGGTALRDDYAARHLIAAAGIALSITELTAELASALLLGPLGGLDGISLRRLRLALRQEEIAGDGVRSGDDLILDALSSPGRLVTIDSAPARRASRLAITLRSAHELASSGCTIEELLWQIWERSGLAPHWQAQSERSGIVGDEANRHLDGVVALFTAAKRFVERSPERPAADFVEELLGAEVPEDTLAPQAAAGAVLVCTPSGAIGTEFAVVGVCGLQEGVWPNLRLRGSLLHPQLLGEATHGDLMTDVDERVQVLGDELRMFSLAVSRAREQVIVSATSNDDDQPSVFLRLVNDSLSTQADASAHPLSLRGLVGRLRRRVADPWAHDPDAAPALARLASEGVVGADPSSWYGLLEPSTMDPLVDLNDPEAFVSVSPSKLETFEKSPLAWFIDTMAATPSGLAAGIGTVVHAVMEEVSAEPNGDVSLERVWRGVEERWGQLAFESPWVAERERRRTRRLAEGMSQYLGDFERSGAILLGSEGNFTLPVGRAMVSGKIDRIERTAAGTVVIVDLKTGKTAPSKAALAEHAQLGTYQLALTAGAIGDALNEPESGGAKLLFVGSASGAKQYKELIQHVLDDEGLQHFRSRIEEAAAGMAGSSFGGVVGLGEHDHLSGYQYRIHLVSAVSA
jgi:superfamily I DNA/RNA helicase/RecB family exonuclease